MSNKLNKYNEEETGFTLIELLVVILIIGILAAIAIPVFLNQQKAAVKSSLQSDVHNTVTNAALALTKDNSLTGDQMDGLTGGSKVAVVTGTNNIQLYGDTVGTYGVLATNPSGAGNYSFMYDSSTGKYTSSNSIEMLPPTVTGNKASGFTVKWNPATTDEDKNDNYRVSLFDSNGNGNSFFINNGGGTQRTLFPNNGSTAASYTIKVEYLDPATDAVKKSYTKGPYTN